jgi:hypothetical protein
MALTILQLDGVDGDVELRTTDPMTCRAVWRLISTAVTSQEMAGLTELPAGTTTSNQ